MMSEITVEKTIQASQAEVFKAWTNPRQIEKWWIPRDWVLERCEMDTSLGGNFALEFMNSRKQKRLLRGHFIDLIPNERLMLSWQWEHEASHSVVEMECHEGESGATQIQIVHSDFPVKDQDAYYREFWHRALRKLDRILTGSGLKLV